MHHSNDQNLVFWVLERMFLAAVTNLVLAIYPECFNLKLKLNPDFFYFHECNPLLCFATLAYDSCDMLLLCFSWWATQVWEMDSWRRQQVGGVKDEMVGETFDWQTKGCPHQLAIPICRRQAVCYDSDSWFGRLPRQRWWAACCFVSLPHCKSTLKAFIILDEQPRCIGVHC